MALTKNQRVQLIYNALENAPTPSSATEARDLIDQVIDSIEDQFSNFEYDDDGTKNYRGRMYGLRQDSISEIPGGILGRTMRNYVYLWNDGGIVILTLKGETAAYNLHQRDWK